MPEKDPCQSWLEEFRREVDAVISAHPLTGVDTPQAQADFSDWWQSQPTSLPDKPAHEEAAGGDEQARLRRQKDAFLAAIQELQEDIASAREYYESALRRLKHN